MRNRDVDAFTIKPGPCVGAYEVISPVVPPLWELLALFGLIGTIASGPGIAAALMLLLHWLRGK